MLEGSCAVGNSWRDSMANSESSTFLQVSTSSSVNVSCTTSLVSGSNTCERILYVDILKLIVPKMQSLHTLSVDAVRHCLFKIGLINNTCRISNMTDTRI